MQMYVSCCLGSDEEDESSYPNRSSMAKEIENLSKERALLLRQTKEDTERLSNIKKDLLLEYQGQLSSREEKIEQLEDDLHLEKIKTEKLSKETETFSKEMEELNEILETLRFDSRKARTGFEQG